VSRAEQERLFRLADRCKDLVEVVAAIGPPDRDVPMGSRREEPERDERAPQAFAYRRLTYSKLSDSADLHVDLHPDGRVASYSVSGKYLGTPSGAA
jgi:hypothetical protein